MTREEAITILGDNEYILFEDEDTYNREAFRMAIKALSQEPTKEEQALLQKWRDNRGISIEEFEDAMNALQEPTDENLHREREQAYMQGYEEASKRFRQEPCDDAISREAVKEIICAEFVDTQDGMSEWRNAVNDVVEEILHKVEHLPSVTQKSGHFIDGVHAIGYREGYKDAQKQKSGKWIYRREDKYSCSKCGTTTSVDEAGIDEKPMYKFCPYCGAKMESEAQE